MFEALRTIRVWQAALFSVVVVAMLGATYGGYLLATGDGGGELAEDQQLIPVQRGDLINEVSVSGSLLFPERETLHFGSQGTVGRVIVKVGQQVGDGDPLVVLDEESITGLEKNAAQARVDLRDAEDALTELTSPAAALALAQAEAAVADARLAHTAAGDALAALLETDPREVAQAELAVTNATGALEDAREALDILLGSPTAEEVARAESAVAVARLSLGSATDSLDALLAPTAEEMARAESTVADARLLLRDAEEALETLLNPTSQQIADAEAAVTRSRLAAAAASEALRVLKDGPDNEEIALVRSDVDSAQTALTEARLDLDLATKVWDGKVQDAADAAQTSVNEYRGVFREWLGAELSDDELGSDPGAILSAWGADLVTLFGPGTRFTDLREIYSIAGFQDDPATRWDEAVVSTWVNFYPGAISTACDDGSTPFQGQCIQKQMDDIWDRLARSRDDLDTLEIEAAKALSKAETTVSRAEDSLADSEVRLADLLAPSDVLDVDAAETDLELALLALQSTEQDLADLIGAPDALDVDDVKGQMALAAARLSAAETELAALEAGADDAEVDAATKEVGVTEAALATAEADLATLLAGPGDVELDAKKKQIALAEADLDKATSDLAELMNGADTEALDAGEKRMSVTLAMLEQAEEDLRDLVADPETLEVSLTEADVAAARAALETALQRLEDAVITAPWDGIVSLLNVEAGDSVNPNTPVLEIVDPTVVEVDGVVDEIDVLFIRVGASASVTLDALPGQVLSGSVSEVASEATNQQGVVSYPLRISVETPQGVLLPEGLTAVASVILREELDVLLLPVQALRGTFDEPVVLVSQGGQLEERPVILGNSDGFWVVIESGLAEAEGVIMQSEQATTQQGFQALRGLVGGGFGGPGGGGFRGGGQSGQR